VRTQANALIRLASLLHIVGIPVTLTRMLTSESRLLIRATENEKKLFISFVMTS